MLGLLLLAVAQDATPPFVRSLGHPDALVLTGADAVGADAVRRALLADPDFLEASLPIRRLAAYVDWLESAVTLAYQNAGFVQARVTAQPDEARGEIELEIDEGEPFAAAELAVEGAQDLDVAWIREVLRVGSLGRSLTDVRPVRRPAEPLPRPFWVSGEPAPASAVDRERLERLARSAVVAAGFLDADARVSWALGDDATVQPTLTLAREGPRSFVHDVRFEGALAESSNSPEELRARVAIDGMPASARTRWLAEDRLHETGRFLAVNTRYEKIPGTTGRAVLAVRVVPNPIAPPVTEQPSADLAPLVAGVDRLARLSLDPDAEAVGMKLDLDVRPAAFAELWNRLEDAGLDLGDGAAARYRVRATVVQRAASLELVRAVGDAEPAPLLRLWVDANGGRIECPPLGIQRAFGPTSAEVLAVLQGTVKPILDDPARPVSMNLSGGIQTNRRRDSAPIRVVFDVHPSLLLYVLSRFTVDPESDDTALRMTLDADPARAQLTASRDGSRLVVHVHLASEGVEANFTIGDLSDVTPPEWSRAPIAPAGGDPETRALGVALEVLRAVLAASRAEERRTGVAMLALTGVQAFLASPPGGAEPQPELARRFHVPRRPTAPGEEAPMRRFGEQFATFALASRAPGSWPDLLLRSLPLLVTPTSQGELSACGTLLGQIAQDPARGPLGAWLATEFCAGARRPNWSRPMAQVGLADLGAARFVADCDALLGAPGDAARGAGARRIVAAWRSLYRRALDDGDPLLDAGERAALRALFEGASIDDDRAIWEAGLGALWNDLLRDLVSRRLDALAAG